MEDDSAEGAAGGAVLDGASADHPAVPEFPDGDEADNSDHSLRTLRLADSVELGVHSWLGVAGPNFRLRLVVAGVVRLWAPPLSAWPKTTEARNRYRLCPTGLPACPD